MEKNRYFNMDLQLFADESTGEKTEKATPRRREDARKKGQVFKSVDLSAAFIILISSMTIYFTFSYMVKELYKFTQYYLSERTLQLAEIDYTASMFIEVVTIMAKISLPVMVSSFLAALLINYLQVGFIFSSESLAFKVERLNPIEGFKQKFSKRALVELIKSLLKILITANIAYSVLRNNFNIIPAFIDMSLKSIFLIVGQIFFEISLKVGIAFIVIGIFDYLYQRYEHETSLKMSKYDIKQEYKQTEGDPLIKSRQRQIQREAAMKRMMAEVPHADVVITNPTHFAVALQYDASKMDAPIVVAKGQDYIALKIREIAAGNDVVIKESPVLARALYNMVAIGEIIPPELFQAVAEVLAFVYKQKGKKSI